MNNLLLHLSKESFIGHILVILKRFVSVNTAIASRVVFVIGPGSLGVWIDGNKNQGKFIAL
jgi:hypothetical protein